MNKASLEFKVGIFVVAALAVLGGLVVKAGDRVIDNSLKSQIRNLKTRFQHGY